MIMRKKRHFLYYAMTLVFGLATIFIIHSCSTDEYYSDELQIEENGIPRKSALSSNIINNTNSLIDSIAISDEFWEFERNSRLLADKFQAYTSTLSEEEHDKFMENLNDDDYMEEFIRKANLEKELQQMNEAKENLLLHTGFSRLSEDERISLFRQYAESHESTGKTLIKTRTEGGDANANSCEAKRQAAYAQAKADYDNAIIKCKQESSTNNYCYTQALANYERCKDIADINYKTCIGK
ncbi:MAG: hypothetical protein K2P55_08445 [Bacteroides acidifaciens]|nr:hypothetical protein [Bacteroides acidifaciens]MDE6986942.1 hypothetical protein [Bacteroides acidifaciens]